MSFDPERFVTTIRNHRAGTPPSEPLLGRDSGDRPMGLLGLLYHSRRDLSSRRRGKQMGLERIP